jgi:hypothetical protein
VSHALDHLFVFCRDGAPELSALQAHGLAADLRRDHQGQGTQNACLGFRNGYLELLWLHDEQAARDPHVKPLGLHERARWRDTAASPFGICVRPDTNGLPPPFPTWDYRPRYLPAGMTIDMACNSGVLGEPLLFRIDRPFVAFGSHRLASRTLRQATLATPDLAPMSLLRDVAMPGLRLIDGDAHLLELEFDDAREQIDLRPALPLRLRL